MSEFWAAYKDPRWQKRKAEILERDGYTCVNCGDTTKMLHAHHKLYRANKKPWEYEDDALETLCEDCHKDKTEMVRGFREVVAKLDPESFEMLIGYAKGLLMAQRASPDDDGSTEIMSWEEAAGLLDSYSKRPRGAVDQVIGLISNGNINHESIRRVCLKLDVY